MVENKNLLIIQHFFPPVGAVGGVIRSVKFMKYMHALGWRFHVVTMDPEKTIMPQPHDSAVLLAEVPADTKVYHVEPLASMVRSSRFQPPTAQNSAAGTSSFLNSSKRRVLKGLLRILKWTLFIPDPGILWSIPAAFAARKIIQHESIQAIFVSTPGHSTGVAAWMLKRLTGKPVVLDVRDDWLETADYRRKPAFTRWIERQLERQIVHNVDTVITVSKTSLTSYRKRYAYLPAEKFVLIPNGTDLAEFEVAGATVESSDTTFTIVCANSGIMPGYRDATPIFLALKNLLDQQPEWREKIRLHFLGYKLDPVYHTLLQEWDLCDVVSEIFPESRVHFIEKITSAELLLAIQVRGFLNSVSGTLYEYWAVGRAQILLVSEKGASSSLVKDYHLGVAVEPEEVAAIQEYLLSALTAWQNQKPFRITRDGVEQFDRKNLAKELSDLLNVIP
jgi:glycosyltransferase involved in cell wall biosynthesis